MLVVREDGTLESEEGVADARRSDGEGDCNSSQETEDLEVRIRFILGCRLRLLPVVVDGMMRWLGDGC